MRLLADENFNGRILKGILKESPTIEILRVQDLEIYEAEDPIVLEWAATRGFILLTHDIKTIPQYAYERIRAGLPMPGVIVVHRYASIGVVIEDLTIILDTKYPKEYYYKGYLSFYKLGVRSG